MRKLGCIIMCLMMLVGCSKKETNVERYNAGPIRFYSELQEDGWMYYSVFLEETKEIYFTGVNLRHLFMDDHYITIRDGKTKKEIDRQPSRIAALVNGEKTQKDQFTIDDFLSTVKEFPVDLSSLELETLDKEVVERIVNKAYEAKPVDGPWELGVAEMFCFRDIDEKTQLSLGQVTTENTIIAVLIDVFDGEKYLRDMVDLTEEEKKLVNQFESIEKEIIEKQSFLVIEDSDDPVMHQLYLALQELESSGDKGEYGCH